MEPEYPVKTGSGRVKQLIEGSRFQSWPFAAPQREWKWFVTVSLQSSLNIEFAQAAQHYLSLVPEDVAGGRS